MMYRNALHRRFLPMRDLEQFYQTMRMHFAFEQMCYGYDELALTLYEDGRYFAGLPFFEKYKYAPDSFPEVDYSSAGGDLLKEMQLDNEARKERTQGDGFERVPFDYYEQLQETLVDMIPDFRIRLKVDPRTRKWFLQPMCILLSIFVGSLWRKSFPKMSPRKRKEPPPTSSPLTREWSCPARSAEKPTSEPPTVPSPAENRNATEPGKP